LEADFGGTFDRVLLLKDPGITVIRRLSGSEFKVNYRRLVFAALEGARAAKREWLWRLRCDCHVEHAEALAFYTKEAKNFEQNTWSVFRSPVLIPSLYTRNARRGGAIFQLLAQRAVADDVQLNPRPRHGERVEQLGHAFLRHKPADEEQLAVCFLPVARREAVRIDAAGYAGNFRLRLHSAQIAREVLAHGHNLIGISQLDADVLRLNVEIVPMANETHGHPPPPRGENGMRRSAASEVGMNVRAPIRPPERCEFPAVPDERQAWKSLLARGEPERGQASCARPQSSGDGPGRWEAAQQGGAFRKRKIPRLGWRCREVHNRQRQRATLRDSPDFLADERFRKDRKGRNEISHGLHAGAPSGAIHAWGQQELRQRRPA
jgi:hypothetical protein